jgi:hypothetical protein
MALTSDSCSSFRRWRLRRRSSTRRPRPPSETSRPRKSPSASASTETSCGSQTRSPGGCGDDEARISVLANRRADALSPAQDLLWCGRGPRCPASSASLSDARSVSHLLQPRPLAIESGRNSADACHITAWVGSWPVERQHPSTMTGECVMPYAVDFNDVSTVGLESSRSRPRSLASRRARPVTSRISRVR